MSYTIKDIPFLMEELERNEKLAKQRSLEAWHKDRKEQLCKRSQSI